MIQIQVKTSTLEWYSERYHSLEEAKRFGRKLKDLLLFSGLKNFTVKPILAPK